jgi:hypothetical protein
VDIAGGSAVAVGNAGAILIDNDGRNAYFQRADGASGIDPAGFAWSAQGVPPAGGNPATFTFPSPGFYLVTVNFKDLAGNTATASLSVTVKARAYVKVTKGKSPTKSISSKIKVCS